MADFKRKRKKVCKLCPDRSGRTQTLDYKDTKFLKFFVSDKGKILPRRVTGTCAKHQREVAKTIKISRHMALIPFTK